MKSHLVCRVDPWPWWCVRTPLHAYDSPTLHPEGHTEAPSAPPPPVGRSCQVRLGMWLHRRKRQKWKPQSFYCKWVTLLESVCPNLHPSALNTFHIIWVHRCTKCVHVEKCALFTHSIRSRNCVLSFIPSTLVTLRRWHNSVSMLAS